MKTLVYSLVLILAFGTFVVFGKDMGKPGMPAKPCMQTGSTIGMAPGMMPPGMMPMPGMPGPNMMPGPGMMCCQGMRCCHMGMGQHCSVWCNIAKIVCGLVCLAVCSYVFSIIFWTVYRKKVKGPGEIK